METVAADNKNDKAPATDLKFQEFLPICRNAVEEWRNKITFNRSRLIFKEPENLIVYIWADENLLIKAIAFVLECISLFSMGDITFSVVVSGEKNCLITITYTMQNNSKGAQDSADSKIYGMMYRTMKYALEIIHNQGGRVEHLCKKTERCLELNFIGYTLPATIENPDK